MWFPNAQKVAMEIESLLLDIMGLHDRTSILKAQMAEAISAGLANQQYFDLVAWVRDSYEAQTHLIDFLRRAATELAAGREDWRQFLPTIKEVRRAANSTRRILDGMDRQAKAASAKSRAFWRSQGVDLD